MGALDTTKGFLSQATMDLSRINAFFSGSKDLHNARFSYPHELKPLLGLNLSIPQTSLLLGLNHFDQPLAVRPSPLRRELGNLLIVAPTRMGKGLLAVSQLLTWKGSVIVNDIKGELFNLTSGYRSTLGKVYVIDPTGIGHRYDPTFGKYTDLELKAIAKSLLFKPDEGEGEIFTQRGIRMLTPIFHASRLEEVPLLQYIAHRINEPIQEVATRLHRVSLLNNISPNLATRFLDGNIEETDFQNKFLLSAWGTLTARLDALLTDSVVKCFTDNDFTPQDLIRSDSPVTVYFRWSETDLLVLSPVIRLLWTSLIDGLLKTYDRSQGKNCHPVLLLIDEGGRTAIPHLSDHASTVVGRNIYLWIAIQDLAQLESAYGKSKARTLRNNMESQIYYRPSDPETADFLEHALGKKSGFARSNTHRLGEDSLGLSEQGIPLMTSQDIMCLKDTDIIIRHRNLRPFMAQRMDWKEHPILIKRCNLTPPTLMPLPALNNIDLEKTEALHPDLENDIVDPDLISSDSTKKQKIPSPSSAGLIFEKNKSG